LAYFARSLALDLAPRGIHVSFVMPGFVKTPLTERNDFPMPMMVSAEKASQYIRDGLARQASEIAFPPLFAWLLKTVTLLPLAWQKRLTQRLVR
jgi:short-subunit dehydrogenase